MPRWQLQKVTEKKNHEICVREEEEDSSKIAAAASLCPLELRCDVSENSTTPGIFQPSPSLSVALRFEVAVRTCTSAS